MGHGQDPKPQWNFEHIQMDFIQVLTSMEFEYILVVYLLSEWAQAFSCSKAIALMAT